MQRKHASFFNWSDKQTKEAGIVDEFLDPENHGGKHSFTCFELECSDPPDAWVFDSSNQRTALEIRELVNKGAITAQINHNHEGGLERARVYATEAEKWSDLTYFVDQVNEAISEKDKKCVKLFADGHAVQLLFHSDEMYLTAGTCSQHIASGPAIEIKRFQRVWLLFGYDPKTKNPLLEVTEHAKA